MLVEKLIQLREVLHVKDALVQPARSTFRLFNPSIQLLSGTDQGLLHFFFTNDDFTTIDPAQDDPIVITIEIDKFSITKVLVDQGSLVDILYWENLKKDEDSIIRNSTLQQLDSRFFRENG